jgi:hypothetical protein
MNLPNSYTVKAGAIPAYFDAILDAQPPERFSIKFLENLGFTSTNDRLFIGILKDLGFLNADGVPQQHYYNFIDKSQSRMVLANAIRETFSELFAVNKKANELSAVDAKNKLRTLYAGKKTDNVIDEILSNCVYRGRIFLGDMLHPIYKFNAGQDQRNEIVLMNALPFFLGRLSQFEHHG